MKNQHFLTSICTFGAALFPSLASAQTSGVPEPGVIVYGRVFASDGETTLPASSLSVTLRFKEGANGQTKSFPATVGPGLNRETYYTAQINFLNITATGGTPPPSSENSFVFSAGTPKAYNFTATGSSVASGADNSGVAVPSGPTSFEYPVQEPSTDERGKLFKMDIQTNIPAPGNSFESYMAGFPILSGEESTRLADPDSDGMSNEAEWAFGTDPTNESSNKALHQVVVTIDRVAGQPNSRDFKFTPMYTDGSRSYVIQKSGDLGDAFAWTTANPLISITSGANLFPNISEGEARDDAATPDKQFYRIQATVNGQ